MCDTVTRRPGESKRTRPTELPIYTRTEIVKTLIFDDRLGPDLSEEGGSLISERAEFRNVRTRFGEDLGRLSPLVAR